MDEEVDPAVIKMARQIATDSYEGDTMWETCLRADVLSGNCDDGPVVQAAVKAILKATELASNHCKWPIEDKMTNEYGRGLQTAHNYCYRSIKNFDHLRKES